MPGSSSWMPYAPQGVKGFDDDGVRSDTNATEAYVLWEQDLKGEEFL